MNDTMNSTNNGKLDNSVKYLDTLKEFFIAGLSFREILLSAQETDKQKFVELLLHILPLLYQKALTLPKQYTEVGLQEAYDTEYNLLTEYVSEEEYTLLEHTLENIFGNDDYFLEAHGDEMKFTDAPITSRTSEYLADIFQPISNLLLTAKERDYISLPYAVIHCRKLFEEYWGDRLLAVLRSLHRLQFMAEDNEQNEEDKIHDNEKQNCPIEKRIHDNIYAFLNDIDNEF